MFGNVPQRSLDHSFFQLLEDPFKVFWTTILFITSSSYSAFMLIRSSSPAFSPLLSFGISPPLVMPHTQSFTLQSHWILQVPACFLLENFTVGGDPVTQESLKI